MNRTLWLSIVLASLLSGCALFGEAVEKIAVGVEKYCEQPYTYRSDFRNTVNAALGDTGHTVHVHCAGDPNHETTRENFDMNAEQLTAVSEEIQLEISLIQGVLLAKFPGCFDDNNELEVVAEKERSPEQTVALFLANTAEEFGLELIRETLAHFDDDTSVAGLLREFDNEEGSDNDNGKATGSVEA